MNAPASAVWSRLSAVCDWPNWLPTMAAVTPLGERALAIGRQFRIEQPRLRPAVWTVTELTSGKSFAWESRSPGVTVTAEHRVAEVDDGQCTVLLRIAFEGWLAPLAFLLARRLTREYIGREAEALRTTAEAQPDPSLVKDAPPGAARTVPRVAPVDHFR